VRLWRPWVMKRTPYRVTDVREERGDSTTLVLQPQGHRGMTFLAGQYAWFTFGDSPFSLQQHPFSFTSSDQTCPDSLEITAKELGDFTRSLQKIDVGTKVFVEGPFGRFTMEDDAPGAVFIMGGIGVTPAISILRSMRDRGDRRPCLLIYGNSTWHEAAFRKELEHLQEELNLRVVHVLEEPPSDWAGETGYIDIDLLKRQIDDQQRQYSFFLCGPEPLMDAAEPAIRKMGVAQSRISVERFTVV
jgi:predicted ferric reductase